MGVWSTFEGSITTHSSKKISVLTLLKQVYDESYVNVVTIEQAGYYQHQVSGALCLDGKEAWAAMQKFIAQIKELDPNSRVDITVSIRIYQ